MGKFSKIGWRPINAQYKVSFSDIARLHLLAPVLVKAGMIRHCREVDQPIAGLLTDLKQRGQLEETLVVWASEMGRTPFRNDGLGKNPGREHNSQALCMWMAGGDVKGGATAGETDDFSLRSVGEAIHIRDVHATLLHLMGL